MNAESVAIERSYSPNGIADKIANQIVRLIFSHRRLLSVKEDIDFDKQIEPHIGKIINYVEQGLPIEMILPAFPAKSPNRNKTLSHLPDYGEFLAMSRLVDFCKEIEAVYSPGAKVIICSDGRVFADLIHVSDQHISDYRDGIRAYAEKRFAKHLAFYNLENVYDTINDYTSLREQLMHRFGEPLCDLRKRIKEQREASAMYKGITKFMFEDYSGIEAFAGLSRTAVQRKARLAAYQVIRRSNAWGRLLQAQFPDSLRLSIHPQFLVSEKIGISMLTDNDLWTTPWHSVVVKDNDKVRLLPRAEAEKLGCVLIYDDGRPSHFERVHH